MFITTICAVAAFDSCDGVRWLVFLQHREQDSLGPGAASRGGGSAEVPLLLPGSQNPERPGGRSLWLGHRQLPGRPTHAGQSVLQQADRKQESLREHRICFVHAFGGLRFTVLRFCTATELVTIKKNNKQDEMLLKTSISFDNVRTASILFFDSSNCAVIVIVLCAFFMCEAE